MPGAMISYTARTNCALWADITFKKKTTQLPAWHVLGCGPAIDPGLVFMPRSEINLQWRLYPLRK